MQFKECYQNPFIEERADPYITLGPDGYYYFTASYPMKSADDKDGYDRVILRRETEANLRWSHPFSGLSPGKRCGGQKKLPSGKWQIQH